LFVDCCHACLASCFLYLGKGPPPPFSKWRLLCLPDWRLFSPPRFVRADWVNFFSFPIGRARRSLFSNPFSNGVLFVYFPLFWELGDLFFLTFHLDARNFRAPLSSSLLLFYRSLHCCWANFPSFPPCSTSPSLPTHCSFLLLGTVHVQSLELYFPRTQSSLVPSFSFSPNGPFIWPPVFFLVARVGGFFPSTLYFCGIWLGSAFTSLGSVTAVPARS